MNDEMVEVALGDLRAHGRNSNAMRGELFGKLVAHIERSGRYPPLVVRPMPGEAGAYQVLDGHHRWRALERLGHARARCVVWDVDDGEALVLLATLNRLEGADDPLARAALLGEIRSKLDLSTAGAAKLLPESGEQVKRYLSLNAEPPAPVEPPALESMRRAVHFFLLPEQERRLDRVLRAIGGDRARALMVLVEERDG